MLVEFDLLPSNARLWIYQADKKLSSAQMEAASNALRSFCDQWEAHAQPLRTSFKILHEQFLVLLVDQNFSNASGCSIDGSVRVLKELKEQFGIDFLDRSKVAFQMDNEVKLYPVNDLKHLFASGKLIPATPTFNNLVSTKLELEQNWLIPAEKSWLAKFLPKSTVA